MKSISLKKILKTLANLQFAIGLLFTIGILIAIGTIIEQDQSLAFYKENYPKDNPLFGFLNWELLLNLSLDKIYSSWWFLLVLLLFSASLSACTFTTQLPSVKTFKLWKFLSYVNQYKNLSIKEQLSLRYFNTFVYNSNKSKYHFFRQQKKGYAYSGLLGRIGPIVVHGSIILLLLGSTIGSFQGYIAQQIVPRGEIFHIQNLTKFGNFSYVSQDLSFRINNFWITYTEELKTNQFYSDISLLDSTGQELKRKIIFVNEPLNINRVSLYQTDWDIIGLKLNLDNSKVFQIPFKKFIKGGQKFWFGSLNLIEGSNDNITIVVNDLTGRLYLYDSKGLFLSQSRMGDFFTTKEGYKVQFLDYMTTTGLQIKVDPGISIVYLSFLLLMLAIYVSFFTYSQMWAVEKDSNLLIGGKSNRAVLFFQEEFRKIFRSSKR